MDSPFNRQFSLYESAGGRPFDSTTSLNNLASQSTSRLGSPSVASKSLRLDSTRGRNSPKPGFAQQPISWNTTNQQQQQPQQPQPQSQPQPQQPTDANESTTDSAPMDRLNAFNGFANPLASGYSSIPSYAGGSAAANTFMGFPSYGGSAGYGSQFAQYSNQYGSVPFAQPQQQQQAQQPYSAGASQSQYGGGIYGAQYPYGQSQYGGGGSNFFATSQAELDNSAGGGGAGSAGAGAGAAAPSSASALDASRSKRSTGDLPSALGSRAASRVGSQVASPTISAEEMVLAPANILWHYVDLQGQIQGPFSGVQMNEWLAYMMETTLLRRVNDACFVSFSALKEATGTNEPFIVLLTSSGWTAVMLKATQLMKQEQQPQQAQQAQSVESQPDQQAQQQQAHQQSSVSAISTLVDQSSIDPAPETDWEPAPARRESSLAPGDNVASAFSSLNISESPKSAAAPATAAAAAAAPATTAQSAQSSQPAKQEAPSAAATSAAATTPVISKSSVNAPAAFPPASREPSSDASENASATTTAATTVRAEPAPAPAVDPWKKPAKPAAQVSIAELKQQEMQKQKKSKSESTPRKQSQPSRWLPIEQLQQQQQLSSPTETPATLTGGAASATASPAASAPATWAKKTVHPVRSLAEIQKEQALKTRKANTLAAQTGAAVPATKPAATAGPSTTTPLKSKPSSIDGVAPRAAAGTATPSKSRGPRAVVPQSTSAANTATQSITASASKARPTDELIHWARVSFKDLMKGIDPMELLDIFLSLPANGSAKEFIAESIYSYSKSLDGRRFASDFLSRKKAAEATMGPEETWHDVLSRFNFNPNVEQDPSFKVVTKRRTQKIARPGDSMHI